MMENTCMGTDAYRTPVQFEDQFMQEMSDVKLHMGSSKAAL